MNRGHFYAKQILTILVFLVSVSWNGLNAEPVPGKLKPLRILIIIGDQWEDIASYMVDMPKPTGEYSGYDATPEVNGDWKAFCYCN